ncbi:MAG: glycosyltransferase family 4 protein [candidate division Zixibacteria bacterium]
MKIVYLSHYFPPEVNAPAVRVSELGTRWKDQGADVTVLTGFPNHPTGVIPPEYRGSMRAEESFRGMKVIRTWMYAAANKGFVKRIMNYLSFMFSSVMLGTSKLDRTDILIATSPQFFVAVAGYLISRLKRCKYVFEIRDVWPEEIVAVGAVKNRLIIGVLEAIEMFLYRKADLLVAVAQGTIDILEARGIDRSKMVLIPNGVAVDLFSGKKNDKAFRKSIGVKKEFIAGYIGTHGMAHKLDTLLEAAAILRSEPDIKFLFVGDGAEKNRLIERAKVMNLTNVIFHDQVPRDLIPDVYAACDVCLVPLRQADLFTKNIPSKIFEIMASRRPIIISTRGESRMLVEAAGAGVGATPEDAHEIAEHVHRLYGDRKLCARMGSDGNAFVIANYSRDRLADEYLGILEQVVDGRPISQMRGGRRKSSGSKPVTIRSARTKSSAEVTGSAV